MGGPGYLSLKLRGIGRGSRKVIVVRSGTHIYGSRFTMGQKYLVYAYGEDELGTSRCTRTKSLESATFDLKELGEGKISE